MVVHSQSIPLDYIIERIMGLSLQTRRRAPLAIEYPPEQVPGVDTTYKDRSPPSSVQRRMLLIIDLSKYRLLVTNLISLFAEPPDFGFSSVFGNGQPPPGHVVHTGDKNNRGVSYLKRMVKSVAYQDIYQNLSLSENSGFTFSSAFGDVPPPPTTPGQQLFPTAERLIVHTMR